MKSKISFFNKGMFWKNVTLYWPIWTIYTILLLVCVPGQLWLESNSWGYEKQLTEAQVLNILTLPISLYTIIIACMALLTGLALFSYLFNARTANMIHSLPVDRNQLFGTNVISGLAFLILPQIFTFAVSVLYCLNRGITHLEYLVVWLLISVVTAFVAYSIVTFCSFLTGQTITMVGFVVLINIFSFVISTLILWIYRLFAFGFTEQFISEDVIILCSPLAAFMCLGLEPRYENEVYVGMDVYGKEIMVLYFIIALVLYTVAWLLYKKRHIEHAGDLLTVSFLKPVFRWSVGFCGALTLVPLIYVAFLEIGNIMPLAAFVLLFVVIGMICYWIADMLIKKSFKVFSKKYIMQWSIFSVFLAVSCMAIYLSTNVYENVLPDKEDVAYAQIEYGYNCAFEKEELDKVFAVHEAIIEKKDLFERMDHEFSYENGYEYVTISYYAKDSSIVARRRYPIPYNEEGVPIFQAIQEYEKEPEKLLEYFFGDQYKDIATFGSGWLQYVEEYKPEMDEIVYETVDFDSSATKVLYEAVIADAYAGTLYAHNVYWDYKEFEREVLGEESAISAVASYNTDSAIYISYENPESESVKIYKNPTSSYGFWDSYDIARNEAYWESGKVWHENYISFGADCTNIVNALVELGLITSADEIPE